MRIALLSAFTLLALSGCGKFLNQFSRLPKDGFTRVNISGSRSGNFLSASTALSGGVMIYATGTLPSGAPVVRSLSFPNDGGAAGFTFDVPNGTYRFLVVGWKLPNLAGAATPPDALRCGAAPSSGSSPYVLTGSPVDVTVSVEAANCLSAPFVDNSYFIGSSYLRTLDFSFCAGSSELAGISTNCQGGNESARFFTGSNSSTFLGVSSSGDSSGYSPGADRMLYAADQHVAGRVELYSARRDGTGTMMQNHPYSTPYSVIKRLRPVVSASSGTNDLVAFSAGFGSSTPDIFDLFLTRAGVPGDLKLTPGTHCSGSCNPTAGVLGFDYTADGRYLIFVADNGLGQMDGHAFTATVDIATPATWTQPGHGLRNGDKVELTTTGNLPSGFSVSAQYYVVGATATTFQLATAANGTAIASSGSQSGVHTVHRWSASGINLYSVDLASVDIAGGSAVVRQLNKPGTGGLQFMSGGGHLDWMISPAAPYPVLFVENESGYSNRWELYLNTPDGAHLTNVSTTHIASNSSPLGTFQHGFNYDGSKILWIDSGNSNWPSNNVFKVLNAVSINTNTLALAAPSTNLTPISVTAGCQGTGAFRASKTADVLVLAADQASAPMAYDLYSVDFTNLGSPSATKIYTEPNPSTHRNDMFTEGDFNSSNTYFVFSANANDCPTGFPSSCSPPPFYHLYSVKIGAPNSRVDHSGRGQLPFTASGSSITVPFHGFAAGDAVVLTTSGTLPTNLATGTVYYVYSVIDANTFQLATTMGGPSITGMSGGSGTHDIVPLQPSANGPTSFGSSGSGHSFSLLKDANNVEHILFLSDVNGSPGVNVLWDTTPGFPSAVNTHSFSGAPSGNIVDFHTRGTKAYLTGMNGVPALDGYVYDVTNTTFSPFHVVKADYSSPYNTLFPYSLGRLDVPGDDAISVLPYPFAILQGLFDNSANAKSDLWYVPDFTAAQMLPVKISHMRDTGPIGYYQVSMLSYATDPNGNPDPSTYTPAISSTCNQGAPAGDGGWNSTSLMLPPGPECSSGSCPRNPFLIALDVYPESHGCSGPMTRTILNGLQGLTTPTATSKVKITQHSTAALGLYIKD